ncbi:endogenous retrovirus group 3 member 1 Env polyprotein-like [Pseudopipra pipra]|uniref:endogenous retrovirus group 3 member 1 Env polyprotein-like n=1 Tax=Pseudopipra pipra TaxID=415032 RepID=UPI00313968A0
MQPRLGMGRGGLSYAGPFWILCCFWAHALSDECAKCYQITRYKGRMIQSLSYHSFVNKVCYDSGQLNTCNTDSRQIWVAKNLGKGGTRLGLSCPKGEEWICFTQEDHWDTSDGGGMQDMKREEIIKQRVQTTLKETTQGKPSNIGDLYQKLKDKLGEDWQLPGYGTNLYIDLMEHIIQTLNLPKCWICSGPLMTEEWPWKGTGLTPWEILKWNHSQKASESRPQGWILISDVIGQECIERRGRETYKTKVGESPCLSVKIINTTGEYWWPKKPLGYWTDNMTADCTWHDEAQSWWCNDTDVKNPFESIKELKIYWDQASSTDLEWVAPEGLFWICGKRAYTQLPKDWRGVCTLGIIQPGFFLLPPEKGMSLGVPLYDDYGTIRREKREDIGGTQKWYDDEWPPERIIATYGPATWAQDGSWGYRTPIYMLNRIIRLQAVMEIVANKTVQTLDLITSQQSKTRVAVYQNRLALDYLLAEEGGVCGKFNTSDCCLQIDDNRQAVMDIAKDIRKLTHVPVQKWNSMLDSKWWDNLLGTAWWKKVGFFLLCALASIIFLPCLIPCFIRLIVSVVQGMQISTMPIDPKTAQSAKVLLVTRTPPSWDEENVKLILSRLEQKTRINNFIEREEGL